MPVPGLDPGIVAGIHVFLAALSLPSPARGEGREGEDVDGRDNKPGHDSVQVAHSLSAQRSRDKAIHQTDTEGA